MLRSKAKTQRQLPLSHDNGSSHSKGAGRMVGLPLFLGFVLLVVIAMFVVGGDPNSQQAMSILESLVNNGGGLSTRDATRMPYQPVSCGAQIERRNREDAVPTDPNAGMDESPKKLTITKPPFWIALHKQYFDLLRWNSIYKNGNYYETGVTDQFAQILSGTGTEPGLVLDIGMNIGWFTLWARAQGHKVAAFEPNPIMHTRVCESLVLNNWASDDSVHIFPYGLGREESTLQLTTGNNPGKSSFFEDRLAKRYRKSFPVRVVTLDSVAIQEKWLEPSSPPIHLMKVDVEGYEPFVFGGGAQLLKSGRVQNIIMENSGSDLRMVTDMFAAISAAGYNVHFLSTVNGDSYHPEMIPGINKDLKDNIKVGMELADLGDSLDFFTTVNCNIWWKLSR